MKTSITKNVSLRPNPYVEIIPHRLKWIKYYLTTALKFLLCMTKNSQILKKSFLKKLNDKINPIKSKHWSFMMTGI